jgi:transposase
MAKKKTPKKTRLLLQQQVHPHCAGIDVSPSEMMVAIPPGCSPEPVRSFGTTTSDLRALRDHLRVHQIVTVAMESTGLYWVPLYDVLEAAGIEVCLVNARHVQNVPGRKTDVCDAQWLQQLHTAGLLRRGFRPPQEVRRLRELMRERGDYIELSSHQIMMMQRCFDQMNIQLHHVISDLDGDSGQRIIAAILAGERNPEALERLRNYRCKTPKADVIKALEGHWNEDCVARLGRAQNLWKQIQTHLAAISRRMEEVIAQLETPVEHQAPASQDKTITLVEVPTVSTSKHLLLPNLREQAQRLLGTDLTEVPGISHATLGVILSEVGTSREFKTSFPSSKQFCSWLGLCPNNAISGGRILGSKTRQVNHRLAAALRLSAYSLWRNASALGEYCRRMKSRLGKAEGITATAHKLARMIYTLITTGAPYDENIAGKKNPEALARSLKNLQKRAQSLGYELVAAS